MTPINANKSPSGHGCGSVVVYANGLRDADGNQTATNLIPCVVVSIDNMNNAVLSPLNGVYIGTAPIPYSKAYSVGCWSPVA